MLSWEVLQELRSLLHDRQIGAGIKLLQASYPDLAETRPDTGHAGLVLGVYAQWVDVGFEDRGLLNTLLDRFPAAQRQALPLADYVQLRIAEAVVCMRKENLTEALEHLNCVLALERDIADPRVVVIAGLWKARCLRKAGEYEQALEVTQHNMQLAESLGMVHLAAVLRTLESWMLFQKGDLKEAVHILQGAEAVLRDTDDFITLGNIQSAYGRIALREGRYDHAMQYFDESIRLFQKRSALEGYLARSLTNIAQAKRFLALQLRRSIDAKLERQRAAPRTEQPFERSDKAGQLERMQELLHDARRDLKKAEAIYHRGCNYHGAGNVDVNMAQICLTWAISIRRSSGRASLRSRFDARRLPADVPLARGALHDRQCAF